MDPVSEGNPRGRGMEVQGMWNEVSRQEIYESGNMYQEKKAPDIVRVIAVNSSDRNMS